MSSLPQNTPTTIYHLGLGLLVLVSLGLGVCKSLEISISYKEALLYFSPSHFFLDKLLLSVLHAFVNSALLPKDLALRLPGLLLHGLNIVLIYLLSVRICAQKPYDPLLVAITFALLPGVQLGAVLLSKASLLITLTLLCLLLYKTYALYLLAALATFLDASCAVLLAGLLLNALKHKQWLLAGCLFAAFCVNFYIFAPIMGIPQGFFLNTLFLMLILYSPGLCIYYPYTLYAQVVKDYKQESLVGIVGAVGFCAPLLLSLRQEPAPEFLSFGACGMPILLQRALSSIRSHLPIFRSHYRIRYSLVFGTLLLESVFLLGGGYNQFVRTHYVAKELASALQKRGIDRINTLSPKMALRLKFYGIGFGGDLYLIQQDQHADIQIRYRHKTIARYAVLQKHP
ncbi:hypothetical protein HHE02_10150 [Helicobacter heilmannii]|uniref:Membrane protein n=1 Tax=Helicobacter heilmannii TaxID=35817 RepID=A0A0K2XSB6_HELHE|nr:hypothetical protein [Helicobacter heilmannii]CCM10760.1 putative integral membrane protein [Helicobacter heilmannii ASB1.4]CRF46142.1 hypothetical protein HHE014_11320 [Helicobacter heilmannii]CRF47720.1 hypothetical protein HHE02_10150 [Helicobacter heilmannii]CRF50812.1 hypothetical protein HHE06_06650 [Helicobacter heilmannii]CRI35203.1 membrane protein [Helicobacter heilmannii]